MGMASESAWQLGTLSKGERNLITDVPGVKVGHCTIQDGAVQTGVTAILPHGGNCFLEKCPAAAHVINGFGKSAGLVQVQELGTLETPVVLTNTLSVGTALTALVRRMLEENPDIGTTTGTVNPVVMECNDGRLNDIRGLHVKEEHVFAALGAAAEEFEEGAVGAGTGMVCYGHKGGIGSASRRMMLGEKTYTVGALVLSNFGALRDLMIAGDPVGRRLAAEKEAPDRGSIIVILATDLPLSHRQLSRLARRAQNGIARTGTITGNGSGEIALAFSTANRIPHYPASPTLAGEFLHEDYMDHAFRAAVEAVEESIVSSLLHAKTNEVTGQKIRALSDSLK